MLVYYNYDGGEMTIEERILLEIKGRGSVTFPYSDDDASCYIVTISTFNRLSPLPFSGGNDSDIVVSLIRMGNAFHFSTKSRFYAIYVAEKLGISREAAKTITGLLNRLYGYDPKPLRYR